MISNRHIEKIGSMRKSVNIFILPMMHAFMQQQNAYN